jgi:5-methylcytosine-specific restriction endonuclease McrA
MSVRYYCDRCKVEITLQSYFHNIHRNHNVNRYDLGLSKEIENDHTLLCDDCNDKFTDWRNGHNAV